MRTATLETVTGKRYEALFHQEDILPEEIIRDIMRNVYEKTILTVRIPHSERFIQLNAAHVVTYWVEDE